MSVVLAVLHPGTNCMSPDTSRMVLDNPSNQGVHQGTRAAEMQAQQYDEQPEGLEARMAAFDSAGLGWRGLIVERYQMPPCELPDLPVAHHIVELASQQHVSLGERPDWRGYLRPFSKDPV